MLNIKHVNDFLFSLENMLQEIAVNYGIIGILHICVLISENIFPAAVLHTIYGIFQNAQP
jgi:hypothetical protein